MSLLVPAALAFAFIIPLILLLYFMRPKRLERTIGSTFLWQQALQNLQASQPWQRLRFTPLLLLQLLAAVALILVLARPALLSGSTLGDNTIVILQASASMQATDVAPSRFEVARSTLSDFIDELGTGDQLSLMTMARTPRVLIADTSDKTQLKNALHSARVTNQDADLEQALSLALSLSAGRANTQILVVGDGHVMNSSQVLISPVPVRYLQIGTSAPNAALLALAARPLQGKLFASAQVANYAQQARALPVELYSDGHLVGVQTIALASNSIGTISWGPLDPNTRTIHAHIISQDALAADHDAWALVGNSQRGRVLLVTKSNVFLEKGLKDLSNVDLYETTPDKYVKTNSYDLTIFDGYQPPGLPDGNLFFINPPAGSSLYGSSGTAIHVSQVNAGSTQSELLNAVDVSSIHTIRASHLLRPASWLETVLTAPETPLLVAGQTDNRRVAVLGFDLHDSNLPLQSAWPILLYNLTNWFLPQPVGGGQVIAGQPVTIQPWPGVNQITITAPDQRSATVAPPLPVQPYAQTDQVGLYQVTQHAHGQILYGAFTVNLFNPNQSNLPPASQLPIAHSTNFSSSGSATTHQLREIWPWIAALLLLILCAEWWLFSRPYQTQQQANSQAGRRQLAHAPPQPGSLQQRWSTYTATVRKRLTKANRRLRSTMTKQLRRGKKRVNI